MKQGISFSRVAAGLALAFSLDIASAHGGCDQTDSLGLLPPNAETSFGFSGELGRTVDCFNFTVDQSGEVHGGFGTDGHDNLVRLVVYDAAGNVVFKDKSPENFDSWLAVGDYWAKLIVKDRRHPDDVYGNITLTSSVPEQASMYYLFSGLMVLRYLAKRRKIGS